MTRVDEIAPDIFRISTYFADFNLQFNQFLVRDEEPLLFETGMKQIFPLVREAVSRAEGGEGVAHRTRQHLSCKASQRELVNRTFRCPVSEELFQVLLGDRVLKYLEKAVTHPFPLL